jgi:hypothetical protein
MFTGNLECGGGETGEERKKETHSFPYLPLTHILATYYRNKTKLAGHGFITLNKNLLV